MDYYIKEFGWSEGKAASHETNIWDSPARNRVVGKLKPGTHALILAKEKSHYKIKTPRGQGGAVGWIGKIQVRKVVSQDTKTFKLCK